MSNPRQRGQIMVHAINLNIDNSVKGELKNLATLQNTDPRLQAIKQELTTRPNTRAKYVLNNDILYCKGDKEDKNWKATLPECLEQKVMLLVLASLGHLGSDM